VDGVTGVGVVRHRRSGELEWSVGSDVAFVTRASTERSGRPVAPVVSNGRSAGSRSSSAEAAPTVANGGGAVSLPAVCAPSVSGGGKNTYGVLLGAPI
jgi:hypothetical protein